MGCSASRPSSFLTKNNHLEENPSYASSSLDNHSTFSSHYSSPPLPKALSLQTPLVHHPPSKKGDSHHLVSLTSTTYGSLILVEPLNRSQEEHSPLKCTNNGCKDEVFLDQGESFSPDSVINTWELMDGLDDDDDDVDYVMVDKQKSVNCDDSLVGFEGSVKKIESFDEIVEESSISLSKPLWKHLSEESLLSKMDPNVASSYRRALSSRQLGCKSVTKEVKSIVSSQISASVLSTDGIFLHGTEDKIVLYFTSLRGIRKTYEDCYAVRMIFRGFRVLVDERDISMDSTYRKELQGVLQGKAMSLPQVFIRGNYVGGVEEIRQLHETGELARLLEGFPVRDPGLVCEICGDARFVPCSNCSGSRKVFDEDQDRLRRCLDCNENGLIRCPGCCE